MTTSVRVALIAAVLVAPCRAQSGTIIFYTDTHSTKNTAAALLPRSQQPFTGWLFDGPQRLAHMRSGRFMALHLKTGAHSFTVPWHSERPSEDMPLVITVEDGGRYCVRLFAKMTNFEVIPWGTLDSQIEEVPCQHAQQNAAHLKPIEIKRVDPTVRSQLDPSTAFPVNIESKQ